MKPLFRIPKPLGIAVIFSTIIYLLINLYLIRFEELFEGGYELSVLVSRISLSFITGYFFYVVVHQLKSEKDKKNLKDFLAVRIEKINGSFYNVHNQITEVTKEYTSIPPEKEEIENLLNLIDSNPSFKPSIYNSRLNRNWTWFELMISEKNEALKQINLLLMSHNTDSELLKILGKIVDSKHFFWIDQTKSFGVNFNQFSLFSDQFYEYSKIINELIKYAYKNDLLDISNLNDEEKLLVKKIGKSVKISKNEIEELINKTNTQQFV